MLFRTSILIMKSSPAAFIKAIAYLEENTPGLYPISFLITSTLSKIPEAFYLV